MITLVVLVMSFGVSLGCLGHLVYRDLKERIIPRRDCYLIAVFGTFGQLVWGGVPAWFAGCAFGALALACCLGVRKVGRQLRPQGCVLGGGDVRLIVALSLATGPLALWGALGAASAALIWGLGGIVTAKLTLADSFPLAPCLACWPVVSVGIALW